MVNTTTVARIACKDINRKGTKEECKKESSLINLDLEVTVVSFGQRLEYLFSVRTHVGGSQVTQERTHRENKDEI